ncbi:MAG: hypothetical protein JW936_08300 [Sedimentisphaerales bacterium]|nr:hypothetical protein [Sedimentisphaerales bacterium]
MNDYIFGPLSRLFRRPSFVICVLVLGICAGGLHIAAEQLQIEFRKRAVPLQHPLDELDISKMRIGDEPGYELLEARRIPAEIEEELGTRDYIQWTVADLSYPEGDPRRIQTIFITYYTGNPDKVPHVPDWCYVGSGGRITDTENIEITVPNNGTDSDQLSMRILEISFPSRWMNTRSNVIKTVGYFFSVNGDYRCTRDEVRVRQAWIFDRYAYFSKVELNLLDQQDLTREQVVEALEHLAQRLVPVLVSDHWPVWPVVEEDQPEN